MSRRPFHILPVRSKLSVASVAFSIFFAGCGSSSPPASGPPVVTKAEADGIKVGMTLEEAQKTVGAPGESVQVSGGTGNSAATTKFPHVWKNPDGSLLTVTVQDGKVQQVEPVNLK